MSKQNKTINFLYEASKLLPTNELYTAIRSRMMTKCCEINASNSLSLQLVPRCDTCGIVFDDVKPIKEIKPVKKPKSCLRLKGWGDKTKYQILSLKKFNKYKNDKQLLITQCKLCKKQQKITIKKTRHIRQSMSNKKIPEKPCKKPRKKKKKSEFSGLNKSAVLSAKRSLETENNNTPKRQKTGPDYLSLIVTPETTNEPSSNILTPNTINTKQYKNLNDMFTPRTVNKTVIELSDSDVPIIQTPIKKNKKKKKEKQKKTPKIEPTRKIKNNNNVVLVADHSVADRNRKRLNNLNSFLKSASNKPKINNTLQHFLSSFT